MAFQIDGILYEKALQVGKDMVCVQGEKRSVPRS